MHQTIKHTFHIPMAEVIDVNKILDLSEAYDEASRDAVITKYTMKIGKYEADLKVVNSEGGPYVDAVLFENGNEVSVCEPGWRIAGLYHWHVGDDTIELLVEGV